MLMLLDTPPDFDAATFFAGDNMKEREGVTLKVARYFSTIFDADAAQRRSATRAMLTTARRRAICYALYALLRDDRLSDTRRRVAASVR